ncbi:5-(carboxyamino)imidazole ribonucleotide mutase [Weissella oryzae SG25]|uniref:N5-carboxyaminoimidazole ribonucleotide mutase n=1 Tax=Weissella oryzae (strain DSM 25784 / JCM 18191 / LMG 30913 / SG25) TaxID=1329250 RepID=A0A069CV64_WEIOS|nr:5-(carboxyamino)imidazole ribonucleotide mutase [Weissella oryzae]GAK31128.1 5-(carboxyamino)imidazole ribonucleotide mutase [Weissella oryzae SG25]
MADIAIIMGSISDWATMEKAATILTEFGLDFDKKIVSAHRTPDLMFDFASTAYANGYKLIIAGAGGAAHLPGMVAAIATVPVIGVPIESHALSGVDSLYSIVQMPAGVPVATMAIGEAGAKNAALYAVEMLAMNQPDLHAKLIAYRANAADKVAASEAGLY